MTYTARPFDSPYADLNEKSVMVTGGTGSFGTSFIRNALMVSEPIYQALVLQSEKLGLFGHGSTYGGHPVASAVALETLNIYEDRGIVDHVRAVGPRLQEGLRKFADHPLVGEARGIGLIGALELVRDKASKEAFEAKLGLGAHFQDQAEQEGLIIRAIGDTIAVCPPLIIVDEEIDELLGCLGRALDSTLKWVRENGLTAA